MKFQEKIVVKSTIQALTQPVDQVRKTVFDLEESLKGAFLPPQLIPVPDEAPLEIPRIVFKSTNGHSTLNITPIRCELVTNYDEKFCNNIDKCTDYIKEKGGCISKFLQISDSEMIGLGLQLNVRWKIEDCSYETTSEIFSKFFVPAMFAKDKASDIKVEYSREYSDRIYIKYIINNYRVYQSKTPIVSPYVSLGSLHLEEHGIELTVDINDKLGFDRGVPTAGFQQLDDFIAIAKSEIMALEPNIISSGR